MKSVAVACAAIVLCFVGISWAQGNGSEVVTHPGGFACRFVSTAIPGLRCAGPVTLVSTPDENCTVQSNATVITGTVPTRAVHHEEAAFESPCGLLDCDIIVTPTGKCNISCTREAQQQ